MKSIRGQNGKGDGMHASQNVRNVMFFLFESLLSFNPFYHCIIIMVDARMQYVHSTFFLSPRFETLQSFVIHGVILYHCMYDHGLCK